MYRYIIAYKLRYTIAQRWARVERVTAMSRMNQSWLGLQDAQCSCRVNPKGCFAVSERLTVTVEEAGKLLGISRNNAYVLATKGELPTIRLGKRLLVPKAAIEKLLGVKLES